MSEYRAMRDRCHRLLAQLDVRPPVTLGDLVAAVARHHGSRITLVPAELPTDKAFGATGSDASGEVVVYQQHTTTSHQALIVLHELAHILAQHPRQRIQPTAAVVEAASERLAALPESMLHLVLGTATAREELEQARPGLLDDLRAAARPDAEAPVVAPEDVAGSLYDDQAEWEAETMATIMLEWLTAAEVVPVTVTGRRLHAAMGDI